MSYLVFFTAFNFLLGLVFLYLLVNAGLALSQGMHDWWASHHHGTPPKALTH